GQTRTAVWAGGALAGAWAAWGAWGAWGARIIRATLTARTGTIATSTCRLHRFEPVGKGIATARVSPCLIQPYIGRRSRGSVNNSQGGPMGQGIQQPPVEQRGGSSLLDVFKVLYEPGAVFERVRERPAFLLPFLAICVIQIVIYFVNMPFMKAGMAAQLATRPAGGPDPSKFLVFGVIFIPIGIGIALVIGGGLLWVLV